MILHTNQKAAKRRAYAPMDLQDVNEVFAKKREYRQLIAVQQVAIYTGDQTKAARCRIEADKIQQELYRKYDLIL